MAGAQAVETLCTLGTQTWGYLRQQDIHHGVYPTQTPYYQRVIHTLELLEFSAKYQGRRPVMHLNPSLIHFCNYKFSTVWKTLVDNFLPLCIKRVES